MSARTARAAIGACRTTYAEYAAIAAVNWSTLREALKSGKHYQRALVTPQDETDAMRLGRATHTAVFEPDRLLREYVVWEGGRRAGGDWEAFRAMHASRTILKPEEYNTALAIRDAVRGHKTAARLLRSGAPECTLTWTDGATGLLCKARLDWFAPKALVDLKTTRDIEARRFGRHAADMLYHCQFAFASMGLLANGIKAAVKIIAVENEPPHDVAVYDLNDDVLWAGEVRVRAALDLVAECRAQKRWPGRYADEQPLALPTWEFPHDDIELELTMAGIGGRHD